MPVFTYDFGWKLRELVRKTMTNVFENCCLSPEESQKVKGLRDFTLEYDTSILLCFEEA